MVSPTGGRDRGREEINYHRAIRGNKIKDYLKTKKNSLETFEINAQMNAFNHSVFNKHVLFLRYHNLFSN